MPLREELLAYQPRNEQEAQDKAEAQYQLGNTIWSDGEYEIEAEEPKTNEKTMERGEAR